MHRRELRTRQSLVGTRPCVMRACGENSASVPDVLLHSSLSDGVLGRVRADDPFSELSEEAGFCSPPTPSRGSAAFSGPPRGRAAQCRGLDRRVASASLSSDSSSDVDALPLRGPRAAPRAPLAGRGPGGAPSRPRTLRSLPSWISSLSDSILLQGRDLVLRTLSLPAVLDAKLSRSDSDRRLGPNRDISLSAARLIIPRTVSEYFDFCRFSRSHSDGLLLASTSPSGVFESCRDMVPHALSEGLLAGRLLAAVGDLSRRHGQGEEDRPAEPPPPVPVEELQEGSTVEGKILRMADIGFFLDVGATAPGLLRRRSCSGVPRRLLQRGQVLSNLVVLRVDRAKRRFTLGLRSIDGWNHFEEEAYDVILHRIATWAGVDLPPATASASATGRPEDAETSPARAAPAAERGANTDDNGRWGSRRRRRRDRASPASTSNPTTAGAPSAGNQGRGRNRATHGRGAGRGGRGRRGAGAHPDNRKVARWRPVSVSAA